MCEPAKNIVSELLKADIDKISEWEESLLKEWAEKSIPKQSYDIQKQEYKEAKRLLSSLKYDVENRILINPYLRILTLKQGNCRVSLTCYINESDLEINITSPYVMDYGESAFYIIESQYGYENCNILIDFLKNKEKILEVINDIGDNSTFLGEINVMDLTLPGAK